MSDSVTRALSEAGISATLAGAGDTIADVIQHLGEAPAPLLVILPEVDPMARALLIAAIGPLAIERAPAARIGAIDIAQGADPADVVAAARYLAAAASTTGQVLTVAPPAQPLYPRVQGPSDSSTNA